MDDDSKICPVCGETIKAVALKCRFCNTDLGAFAASREQDAEKQLFRGHPASFYKITLLVPFLVLLVLAVGAEFALESTQARWVVIVCFLLGSGILLLRLYWKSWGTLYTVSTQRIIVRHGVLSQKQEMLEVFRIDHFELRKPLSWRLLGRADLHLFSSDAEFANFNIYAIPDLEKLENTLRECQLRERTRRNLTTFVKA